MLERNDTSLALRAAARVQDDELPRIPASVSADLARAITDSSEESAEEDSAAEEASQQPAVVGRNRRHRLVLAMALVTAAATAVTLLQTFGSAAPTAFADWQPVPQILTGAAAQQQIDQCPYFRGVAAIRIPAGAQTLVEQRGRMVSIVFAAGDVLGSCMLLDGRGDGGGQMGPLPRPTGSNIVSDGGGSGFTFDASGARVDTATIAGRAGPQVASILIHRTDGVVVTAAVSDGLWEAWWPGTVLAATLTVRTTDGRIVDYKVASTAPH
jgi:hypothetical protein